MRSNRLFHMCGNLICCCTSTLQYNARFAAKLQLDRCFCHCHDFAIVAANAEITKVLTIVVSEKEETIKNRLQPSMVRSLFSRAGRYRFQLILKAITSCAEERSGCMISHSQPLFSCMRIARSTGKKGWPCETKVWPHETRRIELKKVNTQSIPCCKD